MNAYSWMRGAGALRRMFQVAGAVALFVGTTPVKADLNPAAIMIEHPNQIKWKEGNGNATAILAGDPTKPGIYVELTKWYPHHMSRPHFHPNDRYIYVVSGTWWVGTGPKYDPDMTVPVPAGSYVTHYAKQIHWDGAKDEEVTLEIVGEGPATTTNAEQK
jgi:quercetin dioxygenase-like cupin family protein